MPEVVLGTAWLVLRPVGTSDLDAFAPILADAEVMRFIGGAVMELGWLLARGAWGRGYATEAATAARAYVLDHLGPPSLVSVIAPENVRSQSVTRRLGATIDGRVELAEHGPADVWRHPR